MTMKPRFNQRQMQSIQRVQEMFFELLLDDIVQRMRRYRRAHGCNELASALKTPAHIVRLAMWDLAEVNQVVEVDRIFDQPMYRLVESGCCLWCGLPSPKLISGECPHCYPLRLQNTSSPGLARSVC